MRKQGRFVEGASQRAAFAAGDEFGFLAECVGNMPFDFFQRFFIDQRADSHARCHAVADGQSGDGLAQFRHVFIIDGIVHVNAIDGDADLPGVTELVGDRAGDGGRDVGIVEDDQGSVATQFHRDVFHGGGRMGDQCLADGGRTGERDFADVGRRCV